MKQIAMLRQRFESRWSLLADDEDRAAKDDDWSAWISRFEALLIDTFGDVFEEAKKGLEPKPPEFAYKTVRDWCLAANLTHGGILFEVENHLHWKDCLLDLVPGAASEISLADMIYRPHAALCLETIGDLRPRSRDLRRVLSEIHPHLSMAIKKVMAKECCATLQEAVENFPVLRGLKEDEFQRFRGSCSVTAITASKELLKARLRTVLEEKTIDRYFRPKEHSPR